MLQMTFVNCIAILSNYFGGEVKFVLVAKVNKSLTRIFSEKIYECFRINTNASKTWLKYRPMPHWQVYALKRSPFFDTYFISCNDVPQEVQGNESVYSRT